MAEEPRTIGTTQYATMTGEVNLSSMAGDMREVPGRHGEDFRQTGMRSKDSRLQTVYFAESINAAVALVDDQTAMRYEYAKIIDAHGAVYENCLIIDMTARIQAVASAVGRGVPVGGATHMVTTDWTVRQVWTPTP